MEGLARQNKVSRRVCGMWRLKVVGLWGSHTPLFAFFPGAVEAIQPVLFDMPSQQGERPAFESRGGLGAGSD